MIAHVDDKKRNDIVLTISIDSEGKLDIVIDQQQPPCGDFMQIGHYAVPISPQKDCFPIKR